MRPAFILKTLNLKPTYEGLKVKLICGMKLIILNLKPTYEGLKVLYSL